MTTKQELIVDIEKLAKESIGRVWKINPLNFYRGYKNRTKSQLLEIKNHLSEQIEHYYDVHGDPEYQHELGGN